MNLYELTYIISSLMEKNDAQAVAAKIGELIKNLGGQIKKTEFGDKKKFAYPINKQAYGFYAAIEFEIEPEKIDDLQKELRLNRDVLRHLIITLNEKLIARAAKAKQRQPKPKPAATATVIPPEPSDKGEKVKIEELDKKLEELLKE